MRLLNVGLASIKTRVLIGGLVAALGFSVTVAYTSVVSANPTVTGPARACMIRSELKSVNVQLDLSISPGRMIDAAQRSLQDAHPGARVVEQLVGRAHSSELPTIDNHNVVILRVDGEPDLPMGGPADRGRGVAMGRVSCAIAVYDSDTGEFLVEWQSLEPRQ